MLDRLDGSIQELDQAVAQQAERHPAAVRLMQHPGVGPVTGLAMALAVGPVERFRNSRKLVSYLGLNPREDSSGGKQRLGSISKQGNTLVRFLLGEAAQTAARTDPQLRRGIPPRQGGGEGGHRPEIGGAALLALARSHAASSHAG